VVNRKGIAVIIGGMDKYGRDLKDIWILDLIRLHWIKLNTQPKVELGIGYIL
jgi:hypothetical protein